MIETISKISEIIVNLGFPIVVALASMWYIDRQQEAHKQEVSKLSEAINNNTLVMQQLIDKLEGKNDV